MGRERECDLKVLLIGSVGGDGMILRMWTRAVKELELAETLITPLLKWHVRHLIIKSIPKELSAFRHPELRDSIIERLVRRE